jgi:hypothetical protein
MSYQGCLQIQKSCGRIPGGCFQGIAAILQLVQGYPDEDGGGSVRKDWREEFTLLNGPDGQRFPYNPGGALPNHLKGTHSGNDRLSREMSRIHRVSGVQDDLKTVFLCLLADILSMIETTFEHDVDLKNGKFIFPRWEYKLIIFRFSLVNFA